MADMDDFVDQLLKTDGAGVDVGGSRDEAAGGHEGGRASGGRHGGAFGEITKLKHAWMNERQAPELLSYIGDDVFGSLVAKVAAQEAKIREMTRALSEGETSSGSAQANQHQRRTMLLVYQTEVDRIKYVMRSYMRTRLAKMEKHGVYLVKLMARAGAGAGEAGEAGEAGQGEGAEKAPDTTEAENTYLHNYLNLVGRHMEDSVLNFLPSSFNSMLREDRHAEEEEDGEPGEDTMTPVPDLSKHVIAIPTADLNQEDLQPFGPDEFVGDRDDVWKEGVPVMLQYSTVRAAVAAGHLRLL